MVLKAQLRIESHAVTARISGELADGYTLADRAHGAGVFTAEEARVLINWSDELAAEKGDDLKITQSKVVISRHLNKWHQDLRFTPVPKPKDLTERLADIALELTTIFSDLGLEVDSTNL